jgi:hypothetical protein
MLERPEPRVEAREPSQAVHEGRDGEQDRGLALEAAS